MSEKTESMAMIADSMRDLSSAELDQVFGGQCHWQVDDCVESCFDSGLSYQICFLNGEVICAVGPTYDPWVSC